jgi:tRNA1Val (adenine37-N6)-methyltransferase
MGETKDIEAERAVARRPAGWSPRGPKPRGAMGDPNLAPGADEDLSFLTGDFRIFQKKEGHRWSLDDSVVGMLALETAQRHGAVKQSMDMGCGIGSVLLMTAWGLPDAGLVGIEAQDVSHEMACRSVRYNGVEGRVQVLHGDLRELTQEAQFAGRFDLVTGTPPYIPIGHGIISDKQQRGPCCFETRGGIEDYCAAAARVVAREGRVVVCAGALPEGRTEAAAERAGLLVLRAIDVIPREGKPVLFRAHVLGKTGDPHGARERFVVRDAAGKFTSDMDRLRDALSMPPSRAK